MAVAIRESPRKSMNYFQMCTRHSVFWQLLRVQLHGDTSGKDATDFYRKTAFGSRHFFFF